MKALKLANAAAKVASDAQKKKADQDSGDSDDGDDDFIQKAIKKPGQLHKDLGVPQGQKIPEDELDAAAKEPGKVGQRARFAKTLKKMN